MTTTNDNIRRIAAELAAVLPPNWGDNVRDGVVQLHLPADLVEAILELGDSDSDPVWCPACGDGYLEDSGHGTICPACGWRVDA